jgi:hypothetical protein
MLNSSCMRDSRTIVHSSFCTHGALCGFAAAEARALSYTRASARAVPSAVLHQLYLTLSGALKLQHARCHLRLCLNYILRTLVLSCFSTRFALRGLAPTVLLCLVHYRALSFSTRGAFCGFA